MKINIHSAVSVPKGTQILVPNPKFDADKEHSGSEQILVELQQDEVMFLAEDIEVAS
jgi:hypothetical protein